MMSIGKRYKKDLPKRSKILLGMLFHKNFCRFSSQLNIYKSALMRYNISAVGNRRQVPFVAHCRVRSAKCQAYDIIHAVAAGSVCNFQILPVNRGSYYRNRLFAFGSDFLFFLIKNTNSSFLIKVFYFFGNFFRKSMEIHLKMCYNIVIIMLYALFTSYERNQNALLH